MDGWPRASDGVNGFWMKDGLFNGVCDKLSELFCKNDCCISKMSGK